MQLPNTPRYTVDQIRQAQPGQLIPIQFGYVVIDGRQAQLYARSSPGFGDSSPKFGVGPHTYQALQEWQRFVYWLLASKPHCLRTPAEIRSRLANPHEPCWLDRQPYQVLVNDDDRLVGHSQGHNAPKPVLIVRGETLMAAVWETASTIGLIQTDWPTRHVMPLEKPSER